MGKDSGGSKKDPLNAKGPEAIRLLQQAKQNSESFWREKGVPANRLQRYGETRQRAKLDEVEEVKGQYIVTEMPQHLRRTINPILQGNPLATTKEAIARRSELRWDDRVMSLLDAIWAGVPKSENGRVNKHIYSWLHAKIFKVLIPTLDEETRMEILNNDWQEDSAGDAELDAELFMTAMYNAADVWVPGLDSADYCAFLRKVCKFATDGSYKPPPVQQQARRPQVISIILESPTRQAPTTDDKLERPPTPPPEESMDCDALPKAQKRRAISYNKVEMYPESDSPNSEGKRRRAPQSEEQGSSIRKQGDTDTTSEGPSKPSRSKKDKSSTSAAVKRAQHESSMGSSQKRRTKFTKRDSSSDNTKSRNRRGTPVKAKRGGASYMRKASAAAPEKDKVHQFKARKFRRRDMSADEEDAEEESEDEEKEEEEEQIADGKPQQRRRHRSVREYSSSSDSDFRREPSLPPQSKSPKTSPLPSARGWGLIRQIVGVKQAPVDPSTIFIGSGLVGTVAGNLDRNQITTRQMLTDNEVTSDRKLEDAVRGSASRVNDIRSEPLPRSKTTEPIITSPTSHDQRRLSDPEPDTGWWAGGITREHSPRMPGWWWPGRVMAGANCPLPLSPNNLPPTPPCQPRLHPPLNETISASPDPTKSQNNHAMVKEYRRYVKKDTTVTLSDRRCSSTVPVDKAKITSTVKAPVIFPSLKSISADQLSPTTPSGSPKFPQLGTPTIGTPNFQMNHLGFASPSSRSGSRLPSSQANSRRLSHSPSPKVPHVSKADEEKEPTKSTSASGGYVLQRESGVAATIPTVPTVAVVPTSRTETPAETPTKVILDPVSKVSNLSKSRLSKLAPPEDAPSRRSSDSTNRRSEIESDDEGYISDNTFTSSIRSRFERPKMPRRKDPEFLYPVHPKQFRATSIEDDPTHSILMIHDLTKEAKKHGIKVQKGSVLASGACVQKPAGAWKVRPQENIVKDIFHKKELKAYMQGKVPDDYYQVVNGRRRLPGKSVLLEALESDGKSKLSLEELKEEHRQREMEQEELKYQTQDLERKNRPWRYIKKVKATKAAKSPADEVAAKDAAAQAKESNSISGVSKQHLLEDPDDADDEAMKTDTSAKRKKHHKKKRLPTGDCERGDSQDAVPHGGS